MNTQTVTENIVILKGSVRAEELNLGGKSLSKKIFGRAFQNQGGSCLLVKILLQFIVCIYNCSYDLSCGKACGIFLHKIYLCAGFRRQMRDSCNPAL